MRDNYNIVKAMKSRRLRWARHTVMMGKTRHSYRILARMHILRGTKRLLEDKDKMRLRTRGCEDGGGKS
jgi:hypothetical protein